MLAEVEGVGREEDERAEKQGVRVPVSCWGEGVGS